MLFQNMLGASALSGALRKPMRSSLRLAAVSCAAVVATAAPSLRADAPPATPAIAGVVTDEKGIAAAAPALERMLNPFAPVVRAARSRGASSRDRELRPLLPLD